MSFEPVGFVLERVYDLLKHEVNILLEDEKELLQGLQKELELIESYFKDMDEVQRIAKLNNVLKIKIQHLMQIVVEFEDFLDQLIYQKEQQQAQRSRRSQVKAFFSRTSNPLIRKHRLVENVKQIRENLRDILERHQGFELPGNISQVTTRRRVLTNSCILKDEIIVGLDEDVDTLVAKFVGRDGDRAANSAIVGMGGSGKTTLAKKFYNHEEIKKAFPKRAWVCVSQEWNASDLLLQICEMVGVRVSESEKMPHVKLQKFLEEEDSCLVVLDDVWEKHALQELLPTLLSGNGRVLITTRKEKIIKFPRIGPFYIHRARRLTPEQSWELFTKIVRNSCDGVIVLEDDDDYAILGKEMLKKCDGLPLAITTLAGFLGTKGTIQQWESIKDCVISMIMKDDDKAVDKVLELSYFDLPYYIKSCFLYLGTFKEDDIIDSEKVIRLWVDEGFIKGDQCSERRRLEEVAMDFLEELVQRCMIQVLSRDDAGVLKGIQIHDLMRDLAIDKAKELNFFQVWSSSTAPAEIKPPYYRAIMYNRDTMVWDNPRLRTLSCDIRYHMYRWPEVLFPFEKLKQLRILSLTGVKLGESAKQIGNLVLLRYLYMFNCKCKIENLDFIKKLRNLQTFTVYGILNPLLKISENLVSSMDHLRVFHLSLPSIKLNTLFSLGVSKSRNLQILKVPSSQWVVKELPAMNIYLRELNLDCISSQEELDVIQGCVGNNLTHLESLFLTISLELGFDLEKMKLGSCQYLKEVYLSGKIIQLQHGPYFFPPKLLSLFIFSSMIEEEEDMKKIIVGLDHLRELFLGMDSYTGDKLTITELPKLQKLRLEVLDNIKECGITADALPQLQELHIMFCKNLERVPNGIGNIHTLQLLSVNQMPETFCKRLEKREDGASDGGEDFHIVQHIPTIKIRMPL